MIVEKSHRSLQWTDSVESNTPFVENFLKSSPSDVYPFEFDYQSYEDFHISGKYGYLRNLELWEGKHLCFLSTVV